MRLNAMQLPHWKQYLNSTTCLQKNEKFAQFVCHSVRFVKILARCERKSVRTRCLGPFQPNHRVFPPIMVPDYGIFCPDLPCNWMFVFVELMRVIQCVYRNGTLGLNVVGNCRLKITRQFHYRLTWVRQLNTLIFWNADDSFPVAQISRSSLRFKNSLQCLYRVSQCIGEKLERYK